MSKMYFSGIEKAATAEALKRERAPGMMSRLEYGPALMEACEGLEIFMDSGAFTKPLTEEEIRKYAALIIQLGERCILYANADKIGDQLQSNKNYEYLLSLLPAHLHDRILWIYQVSADLRYLEEGLERHKRIGIGGLVPYLKDHDKTYAWYLLRKIAPIVASSGASPHYFGLSVKSMIDELHTYHEDFTVDSTTWLIGARYGLLVTGTGKQLACSELGLDFPREHILGQNIRNMNKWMEPPTKIIVPSGSCQQLDIFSAA